MAQSEDMVSESGRVGVVLFNPQIGFMIEQPIQNMRCIPHRGIDDFGVEGGILIGHVGIKRHAGIIAVFEIHLSGGCATSSGAIALSIGR